MPLPDPHAQESTVEVDRDIYKQWVEAVMQAKSWKDEAERLKVRMSGMLGDAYAGTVDGKKVVAHRPKAQWALGRLTGDYPDLVEHFMKWKTERVFDVDRFAEAHPDILAQYQVRAFIQLE